MRIVKCDVCDEEYGPKDDMIEMVVPASFLDEEGEGLLIDACGWPCISTLVDSALNRVSDDEEFPPDLPEKGDAEKPFVMIPKSPTIDTTMTAEDLARYTEQVTGVKRRI